MMSVGPLGCFQELRKLSQGLWRCMCCLLCIGPVALIVAIVCISQAHKNDYKTLVDDYDDFKQVWVSGRPSPSEEFAATTDWAFKSGMNVVSLSQSSAVDKPSVDGGSHGEVPNRVKFTASGSSLVKPEMKSSMTYTIPISVFHGAASLSLNVPVARYSVETYTCKDSRDRSTNNCPSSCSGSWNSARRTCTLYESVYDICVVIDEDSIKDGQQPSLYAEYPGCSRSKDSSHVGGLASLARSTPPTPTGPPYQFEFPFPFQVTVRSSADPWVQVARDTDGSMSFGLSQRTWAILAVVFFVVGGTMTVLPCGLAYVFVRYLGGSSRRKAAFARPHHPAHANGSADAERLLTTHPIHDYQPNAGAAVPSYPPHPAMSYPGQAGAYSQQGAGGDRGSGAAQPQYASATYAPGSSFGPTQPQYGNDPGATYAPGYELGPTYGNAAATVVPPPQPTGGMYSYAPASELEGGPSHI